MMINSSPTEPPPTQITLPNIAGKIVAIILALSRLTGLINRFFRSRGVALPAQFAGGCKRSRPLPAAARPGFGDDLPLTRKTGMAYIQTGAASALGAALAAIRFAFVRVTFAGPFALQHAASGALWPRG
jgi:hypothetical protein